MLFPLLTRNDHPPPHLGSWRASKITSIRGQPHYRYIAIEPTSQPFAYPISLDPLPFVTSKLLLTSRRNVSETKTHPLCGHSQSIRIHGLLRSAKIASIQTSRHNLHSNLSGWRDESMRQSTSNLYYKYVNPGTHLHSLGLHTNIGNRQGRIH